MTKYSYMKLTGLILIILGFSYCITAFSNLYSYLYGDIEIANANIYLMISGLLFPLYMFVFGLFFYFYTDKQFAYINPFVLTSGIIMISSGIVRMFISHGVMEFIHISFGIISIIMGISIIFGCIRYKY